MKAVGGKAVAFPAPKDLGFRPEVIAAVRDAMVSVVSEGPGMRAKLDGIEVAGKTGSAQVVTHARLETNKHAREYQPHGWFICFAPAGQPAGGDGGDGRARRGGGNVRRAGGRPDPVALLRRAADRAGHEPAPDNPPVEPSPQPLRAQAAPPSPRWPRRGRTEPWPSTAGCSSTSTGASWPRPSC